MKNPYPELKLVTKAKADTIWQQQRKSPAHKHWREGYDAKEKEAQGLYEALKDADTVICQLCKRLNPQHAQSPYHDGCESCPNRRDRLGVLAIAEVRK